MSTTNPFERVVNDTIRSELDSAHISSDGNSSDVSKSATRSNESIQQTPSPKTKINKEIDINKSPNASINTSQISISPSLFPPTLSLWMDRDSSSIADDESFHDCRSIEEDDASDLNTSLLLESDSTRHADERFIDKHLDERQTNKESNCNITTSYEEHINETTSLLPQNHDSTPLTSNTISYHATNNTQNTNSSYHATPSTPLPNNNLVYNTQSPLQDALSTWLEPYAQSAKRAGRRLVSLQEKEKCVLQDKLDDDAVFHNDLENNLNGVNGDRNESIHVKIEQHKGNTVRFQPETITNTQQRNSIFNRVASSPALMTTFSNETYPTPMDIPNHNTTIVLKEIEPTQNNNPEDSNSISMHPWTKLILLEELGTASSWTIILLPYAFMILALFLDGDAHLKNTVVGPLFGRVRCMDLMNGRVAEPYGVSVKGYFPVPFSYNSTIDSLKNESEACTYPFELREGVGLLSHGMQGNITQPFSTSIVDGKYRYLMSHGYAFTSGVIPNVPATSQSLIGKAEFDNLSSRAVALVADGGVLTSSIVFQRQPFHEENCTNDNNEQDDLVWSPVLILSPRRLDLRCTLNVPQSEDQNASNTVETATWNCVSNMIEAFFSLPNAALLVGGDLRVDTLISHHKQHRSLSDDFWLDEMSSELGYRNNEYTRMDDDFYQSKTDLIWSADLSKPTELLSELSEKVSLTLNHQSESYSIIMEVTRIFALIITFSFLCYWTWMMGYTIEGTDSNENDYTPSTWSNRIYAFLHQAVQSASRSWKRIDEEQSYFWWESPWMTFPERRYLLLMLFCLLLLQNPLLAYAFFDPTIYSSATFRSIADTLSGVSVHGMLFLWLCLMHGLRYHTADFCRRRYDQYRRVIELEKATQHITPPPDLQQSKWGRVQWYYRQYGDVDGGGAAISSVLRHKHDVNADSFVEFIIPKMLLLLIGIISAVTAAMVRFPESQIGRMNQSSAGFLNPDRFGGRGQLYVFSSVVQIIVIQLWGISIIMSSFVTGERLRREPFLSTRPAQLTFRVLTSILVLGFVISITLFSLYTCNVFGSSNKDTALSMEGSDFVFDTSVGSGVESWDSKADILFRFIRRVSSQVPYVDTSFNIGPGKILYATACSMVACYIFLPSSHFCPSDKMIVNDDTDLHNILSYMKEDILWVKDKMLQGSDKRYVVTLAKYTHTWRVFPLPIRSHGLMSQHTIKESLNLIGTFQLDGGFGVYRFKNGRGSIFKGRYIPVFCVEIACWLLEASWQSYYSPTEYALNDWAPGKMSLHSIGLKLERAIEDEDTDTHAYVATNAAEQVEGEEDSIIVVSFRGTASISNMKTDLSFRQVPLPAKLSANTPSFNIKPGRETEINEDAWDLNKSTSSIIKNILHPSTFPAAKSFNSLEGKHRDSSSNNLLPAMSDGAKALIGAVPMARQALPCVHEGFLRNYLKVRQEIIETILTVLKRQVDKAVERSRFSERSCLFLDPEPITLPKIYLTGHSLGGSLAQLLALDLASNCEITIEQVSSPTFDNNGLGNNNLRERSSSTDLDQEEFWLGRDNISNHRNRSNLIRLRPPIAVYTYGQPRVGNLAFKTIYKQRVPHTFRVVTEGDAFTSMPSLTCLGGIYRHAGLEVLLDEGCTGNILVGPTVVETLLRFTKVRTSVANHSLAKYRDSLESAFEKNDLKEYYQSHSGKVKHDEENLPSWVTNARR